jgi:hypothetical protein
MYCRSCGQNLLSEDKFCFRCGAPVIRETNEAAASASSSPSKAPLVMQTSSSTAEMHQPLTGAATPPADIPPAEVPKSPSANESPNAGGGWLFDAPKADAPKADAPSTEAPKIACPSCGRLNSDLRATCVTCGTPLHEAVESSPQSVPPAPANGIAPPEPQYEPPDVPIPFLDAYSKPELLPEPRPRKARRLPILEILVVVLLLIGAGAAVWMLRSSMPAKKAPAASSNIEVTITPMSAQVTPGHAVDFAAQVSGTDTTEVSWSVQEGEAGGRMVNRGAKAENGQVSLLAVYVAPATPGTYHVVATSKADPQQSAEAEVTVAQPAKPAKAKHGKK